RVGSKCWTMTKAMPLFFGTRDRKSSKASNPPAEAPMPTTGNETFTRETGVSGGATLAGFFRRRAGEDFFFMALFSAANRAIMFDARVFRHWFAQGRFNGLMLSVTFIPWKLISRSSGTSSGFVD